MWRSGLVIAQFLTRIKLRLYSERQQAISYANIVSSFMRLFDYRRRCRLVRLKSPKALTVTGLIASRPPNIRYIDEA